MGLRCRPAPESPRVRAVAGEPERVPPSVPPDGSGLKGRQRQDRKRANDREQHDSKCASLPPPGVAAPGHGSEAVTLERAGERSGGRELRGTTNPVRERGPNYLGEDVADIRTHESGGAAAIRSPPLRAGFLTVRLPCSRWHRVPQVAEDPEQRYCFHQGKGHKKHKNIIPGSRYDDVSADRAKVRLIVERQFLRVLAVARASLRILRWRGLVVLIGIHGSHLVFGLIILWQKNCGGGAVPLRDNPKLDAIGSGISREQTLAKRQGFIVELPIFRAKLAPITKKVTFESFCHIVDGQLIHGVGR